MLVVRSKFPVSKLERLIVNLRQVFQNKIYMNVPFFHYGLYCVEKRQQWVCSPKVSLVHCLFFSRLLFSSHQQPVSCKDRANVKRLVQNTGKP